MLRNGKTVATKVADDFQLFSITRAAQFLDCSPDTVRRMIARGDLRAHRFGKLIRIDPSEITRIAKPVTNAASLRGGEDVA